MITRADPLRVTSAQISRAMRWPIGTAVTVTFDDGSTIETETRSQPFRQKGGRWVILVAQRGSHYPIERVHERAEGEVAF